LIRNEAPVSRSASPASEVLRPGHYVYAGMTSPQWTPSALKVARSSGLVGTHPLPEDSRTPEEAKGLGDPTSVACLICS
jgi:hypothetical protein